VPPYGHKPAANVTELKVMRWQLFRRVRNLEVRLAPRLERAAALINPFLLTIAIGLTVLNVTCFIALQVSPPKPISVDPPALVPPTWYSSDLA
jgi:hypothetical protein